MKSLIRFHWTVAIVLCAATSLLVRAERNDRIYMDNEFDCPEDERIDGAVVEVRTDRRFSGTCVVTLRANNVVDVFNRKRIMVRMDSMKVDCGDELRVFEGNGERLMQTITCHSPATYVGRTPPGQAIIRLEWTKAYSSKSRFRLIVTAFEDRDAYCDEFRCENDFCIDNDLRCDEINHCNDNSDERNCLYLALPLGGIIGIVVAIILVIAIVFIVIFCCICRRLGKRMSSGGEQEQEPVVVSNSNTNPPEQNYPMLSTEKGSTYKGQTGTSSANASPPTTPRTPRTPRDSRYSQQHTYSNPAMTPAAYSVHSGYPPQSVGAPQGVYPVQGAYPNQEGAEQVPIGYGYAPYPAYGYAITPYPTHAYFQYPTPYDPTYINAQGNPPAQGQTTGNRSTSAIRDRTTSGRS